jgi:2-polyprenyl-3-methyl-5-hydroxy-6-metoxy-1,4-benzoquinol methylase
MLLSAFRRWILLSLIPVAIVINYYYSSRVLLVDDTDIDFLYEPEKARRIAKKWDESNKTFVAGGAWHQHALVVKTYKQRLAAGSENFVSHILNRYGKKTKCLSIGCGDGGIETEMVEEGLCETMKGIDLSPIRVEGANSNVPLHLKEKLVFTVENAETGLSGEHYDLVLFTHALHHIFNLEAMIDAILHYHKIHYYGI